jgi:hypothetical protein
MHIAAISSPSVLAKLCCGNATARSNPIFSAMSKLLPSSSTNPTIATVCDILVAMVEPCMGLQRGNWMAIQHPRNICGIFFCPHWMPRAGSSERDVERSRPKSAPVHSERRGQVRCRLPSEKSRGATGSPDDRTGFTAGRPQEARCVGPLNFHQRRWET